MNETQILDTVIVGGGAAGLTAAQVLGRARRAVTVVDAGAPRNAPAEHMHGYLGHDGLDPAELLAIGRREAQAYGVRILSGVATAVRRDGDLIEVIVGDEVLRARTLLVATGLTDVLPDIPGVAERFGRDAIHCPFCHGYEVRDRPLAVLGGENAAMSVHQALMIPQWSRDLIFFTNGLDITADDREKIEARGVRIVDGTVHDVIADDRLRAVRLADGTQIEREAVFVAPRFVPQDGLLLQLGAERGENGFVPVDPMGRVLPGTWAAGNVVNPMAQVIVAAGAGSVAAAAISAHLLERDIEAELARARR
ncbi:FAD-dependent pyridine nucleotide-disulfide oxidoreductase OS=Tsukamurella paurometabola (strain ATCC 8368 / DSM / CCUG 35730 / CIP 100753 / JCM 10117 /KCTC 9821 / NBRC 16120 / NCIMB 702349 / NCTC 13040) OX=521096 GN=Tpau_3666 PE=4 SV=1 [Tsukamurella paurometabola]|uniref:FAD-dependent pyridine nucleotide-disulfide oxidoreductase n=1 Tax=Tsukamurella paurometabola (strain ATCC 8368 / DSM 20162 / CCUG 35730 / CIP 100753 / JCM 10117 / KCTC 9821 / NBRC 16120 / NCIMB 702349 / NCTC 13040) TaxID=521096 RepID=D5UY07_TSUPD|nr:NAD(P)/FAD-dependent oxidoreductase [Tsukamurella paurometabola]ADG80244.1 FAD-dependent pyridine nucleotide-disulfide oxidoreductase [Tsukamurella paurometabola DSM 20162]SUP38985.1 Thioredoxin reductase [Tsukamurella paurometabola]